MKPLLINEIAHISGGASVESILGVGLALVGRTVFSTAISTMHGVANFAASTVVRVMVGGTVCLLMAACISNSPDHPVNYNKKN